MGSADYYKKGDWNVICDQCGRKRKASECRLTWENYFVCADTCWQPRHPQDFVHSIADRQTVPIARPDTVRAVSSTTLSSNASKYATSIDVSSISGIYQYDSIGVELDTYDATATGLIKKIQWVSILDISGTTLTLMNSLWDAASSGNTVYLSSDTNETFVTATSVLASEL